MALKQNGRLFNGGHKITQNWANKHPFFNGRTHQDFYARYGSPYGHNGFDFIPKIAQNLTIHTPVDAKLVHAAENYDNGYGAYVKLQFTHEGQEYWEYFCHLDSWPESIKTMPSIPAGTPIGIMGGSGNGKRYAFGPHLHFGVKPVKYNKNNGFAGYIDPGFLVA